MMRSLDEFHGVSLKRPVKIRPEMEQPFKPTDFLTSREPLGGQNYTGFYSGMSSVNLNLIKSRDVCSL
jgi:hypothetical protein